MGYWEKVRDVVKEADIVFEVLDSRFAMQSRNIQLEELVNRSGKKLVLLVNKADLVGKKAVQRLSKSLGRNCIFISAKKRAGTAFLRRKIRELSGGKVVRVAFCGYPNVGKSSIINALARKKSAGTSSRAGFTKGTQFVRTRRGVMLIDTPGVIPVDEHNETLMVLLCSKNAEQVRDLESTGIEIAEALLGDNAKGLLGSYGIEMPLGLASGSSQAELDGEAFLNALAMKRKKLLSGGKPDLNFAARTLINDFQKGKI